MKKSVYIGFTALILLLLYTPHAVSDEIVSGVNKAKEFWFYGVSIAIICLAFIYLALKRRPVLVFHRPDLFLLVYYIYITAHIFFTDPEKFWLDKFIIQSLWMVLYFILKSYWHHGRRQSERYLKVFSIGLMMSATGQAIIGLMQLYGMHPTLNSQFQVVGTFINPAPFAFFLGAVFPFALAVYFQYKDKVSAKTDDGKNKWLVILKMNVSLNRLLYYSSIAAVILILLILPVTMIRTGWIMALVGSAVVLYWQYKATVHLWLAQKRIRLFIVPALILATVAASFGAYGLKKDSADGRALIWEVTIDKIKEAPVFGQGYGSFYSHYNEWQADWFAGRPEEKERPKAMLAGNVKFAYNEFLEVVAELGVTGLVLLLLFLVGVLKYYRQIKKETIAVFASITSLLVGSLFSYPLYTLPSYILLLLFVSMAVGGREPWARLKASVFARVPALTIALLLSAWFVSDKAAAYKALADWKLANYFLDTNSAELAIETYEEVYPALKKEGLYLQQYGKALSLNGKYKESVDILNWARVYGSDIYLYTTLGDNYKALGQNENASRAYQRAIDMAPHKFYAPYLLARLHFETGDTTTAVQIARKLLEKPVKVHSTAIDEIKQKMKDILTAGDPEKTGSETEGAKPSAMRKEASGKEDV